MMFIGSNAKSPVLGHFGAAIAGLGVVYLTLFVLNGFTSMFSIHSCLWRTGQLQAGIASSYRSLYQGCQGILQFEQVIHVKEMLFHVSYPKIRWICVRVDGLGALFTAGLGAFLVYGGKALPQASNTGFSLNMAVGFSSMILWWVRLLNEFEVSGM